MSTLGDILSTLRGLLIHVEGNFIKAFDLY